MDAVLETVFMGSHQFSQNTFALFMIALPLILMLVLLLSITFLRLRARSRASIKGALKELEAHAPSAETAAAEDQRELEDPEQQQTETPAEEDDPSTAALQPSLQTTAPPSQPESSSWVQKLRRSLARSQQNFTQKIHQLLSAQNSLDAESLDHLRPVLYRADLGSQVSEDLLEYLETQLKDTTSLTPEIIDGVLSKRLLHYLSTAQQSPPPAPDQLPEVIMMVGVNGVGKTTTTAKIAADFSKSGKKVLLCAADTFRAGAISQLKSWGKRIGVEVVHRDAGSDPAAVVYEALQKAQKHKSDALLIDTAGRLHNREDLMDQLRKILRVMRKIIPEAPHHIWLVLDATTGQNALKQVESFRKIVGVNGLIVTKLDGSAKGGALIGISHSSKLPVRYIGLGEQVSDLRPFDAEQFVTALLGGEQSSHRTETDEKKIETL